MRRNQENRRLKPDLAIQADALTLEELNRQAKNFSTCGRMVGGVCCGEEIPRCFTGISPDLRYPFYVFMELFNGNDLVKGCDCFAGHRNGQRRAFQAAVVERGKRMFCNSGAPDGYDFRRRSACFGSGRCTTICVAGDGSLQMNIQGNYRRSPITGFLSDCSVLSNDGYQSIKQTQANFGLPYIGCHAELSQLPDVQRLAVAYGIRSERGLNMPMKWGKNRGGPGTREGPVLRICPVRSKSRPCPKIRSSERKTDGRMVSETSSKTCFPSLIASEFYGKYAIEFDGFAQQIWSQDAVAKPMNVNRTSDLAEETESGGKASANALFPWSFRPITKRKWVDELRRHFNRFYGKNSRYDFEAIIVENGLNDRTSLEHLLVIHEKDNDSGRTLNPHLSLRG